ncbi:hypothetical protein SUDANB105_08074 (plasmid) [Streptomyces sp. enrichment culture]
MAVQQVFADYDMSRSVLRTLASTSSVRQPSRGTIFEGNQIGGTRSVLVAQGTVREDYPDGRARLWKRGALIGDWTDAEAGLPTTVTPLTENCKIVTFTGTKITRTGIKNRGEVMHALAQLGAERLDAVDKVYGADRRPPIARVAGLLRYLGSISEVGIERLNREEYALLHFDGGAIVGPTQVDIADSLGLSRASVEKALAVLRDQGALHRAEPGAPRTNRRYVIKNRGRLSFIAVTGQV